MLACLFGLPSKVAHVSAFSLLLLSKALFSTFFFYLSVRWLGWLDTKAYLYVLQTYKLDNVYFFILDSIGVLI